MLNDSSRPHYPDLPLPGWVEELRPQQIDAVNEAVELFDSGCDVVLLDGPVGSGKTLIGELIRRELGMKRGLYICSDKSLQDQVARDFPYGRILKGRANYRTLLGSNAITCDDCVAMQPGDPCTWCEPTFSCPYRVAKQQALSADLAILNSTMFLFAANYAKFFSGNQFVVADECDLLEDALSGFVEFRLPQWTVRDLNLEIPKKGSHKKTLAIWLEDVISKLQDYSHQPLEPRRRRAVGNLIWNARIIVDTLVKEVEQEDDQGQWVRDYETTTFCMRPVLVSLYGPKYLQRHGRKWLLMSGSIVSDEELVDTLGLMGDWGTVNVPHVFPIENRPIIMAPIAEMTYKAEDREWGLLVTAIERILERHDGRALVHTVSYKLAEFLHKNVKVEGRLNITHKDSAGKRHALERYLSTPNAVMFSPSMNRGVDLAEDKCRIQIICKTPFLSLKDKQVNARLHLPGGNLWYAVQAVRDIVQMTGRGVRSMEDTCITYILDRQFAVNIWRRWKPMFVQSFIDAVQVNEDIRWMLK